jgi:hypothetical protein
MMMREAAVQRVLFVATLALFCAPPIQCGQTSGETSSSPTFRIAGRVVNAKDSATLALARVTIRNVKNPKDIQSQLTREDGSFEFQTERGKYSLQGAKRGFIPAAYDQHEQFSTAIATGASVNTESLVVKLSSFAVLTGKVLDGSGDPVRQARTTLWREDHSSGISRIVRFRDEVTDDLGSFEFAPLDAATYFLSVAATPWYAMHAPTQEGGEPTQPTSVDRALDVVYPTAYYAGATESEDATPIPLRGGDRMEVEMRLQPVPALHVIFKTEVKDESQGLVIPTLMKQAFDGMEFNGERPDIRVISPGMIEVTTAPGKYTVRLFGPGPEQSERTSEVDLTQDHQEVQTSQSESSSTIEASVRLPGQATIPSGIFLVLRNANRRGGYFETVGNKGTATFRSVPPGTYDVIAGSDTKFYGVVGISNGGSNSASHSLKVPAGVSLPVSLTLAEGSGTVEGVVNQDGKPMAGAMVVLIPKHPEQNRELFRRDQSDLDGTFSLNGVIAGSYTVVAIANGWDLDWGKTAVLAQYAKRGQTVLVGGPGTTRLSGPVELQQK